MLSIGTLGHPQPIHLIFRIGNPSQENLVLLPTKVGYFNQICHGQQKLGGSLCPPKYGGSGRGLRYQNGLKNIPSVNISSDKLTGGAKMSKIYQRASLLDFDLTQPRFYTSPLFHKNAKLLSFDQKNSTPNQTS